MLYEVITLDLVPSGVVQGGRRGALGDGGNGLDQQVLHVGRVLVEKTYGKRPPYGIIHYSDRDFAIDYTPELEFALMDLLADMRRDEIKRNNFV